MNNRNIKRRDFIKVFFLSIGFIISYGIFKGEIIKNEFKNKKKLVGKRKANRSFNLNNNLKQEIKYDLKKNNTLWIGKKLYTFTELF